VIETVTVPPHDGRARDYCLPLVVFALFTTFESIVPTDFYPLAYGVKAIATAATLWLGRAALRGVKLPATALGPAVLVGLLVLAEWLLLDGFVSYPQLGARLAFNPFASIHSPAWRSVFLALRLAGLIVVVPIIEELFWRGFALRYLTNANWRAVSVGSFSATAVAIATAGFAVTHPEWLAALIAGAAYTGVLAWNRNLCAPIVAHATTNAGLGAYVLLTHHWQLW
jgi:CAAX protease family protein